MTDKLIPANAMLAAKRGFVRTTSQAFGTSLAGGLGIAFVSDAFTKAASGDVVPLVVSGVVFVFSPLIAGAASFASILARGIPADYQPAEPERPTP